jgi:hypothetical protein
VDGEMFRCRKCRRILGTSANVFPHTPGQARNDFRFCRAAARAVTPAVPGAEAHGQSLVGRHSPRLQPKDAHCTDASEPEAAHWHSYVKRRHTGRRCETPHGGGVSLLFFDPLSYAPLDHAPPQNAFQSGAAQDQLTIGARDTIRSLLTVYVASSLRTPLVRKGCVESRTSRCPAWLTKRCVWRERAGEAGMCTSVFLEPLSWMTASGIAEVRSPSPPRPFPSSSSTPPARTTKPFPIQKRGQQQ